MTLKVGFAQAAMPGSNTTVDLTDSNAGFASDVKAAVIFSSSAIGNNTGTVNSRFLVGLASNNSGTQQASCNIVGADGATPSSEQRINNAAKIYDKNQSQVADLSAWLSTGIRLNETTSSDTTAYLVNALMFGGDIEAKVVSTSWAAETGNKVIAHGLGGAPEVLVGIFPHDSATAIHNDAALALGFWSASGGHAGFYQGVGNGQNPTDSSATSATTGWKANNGIQITVGTVDATNINVSSDITNWTTVLYILAIRGTTTPLSVKTGTFTVPTGTGSAQSISTSFDPQAVLMWSTLQTSIGLTNSDANASMGFGGAITNSGGIGQGSIATDMDCTLTCPSDRNDQISNTKAIKLLAVNGGATALDGAVTSFTGGVTVNYTPVTGSANTCGYLAFAQSAGPPPPPYIPQGKRIYILP